jgi:hypothetical protein
MKTTMTFRHLWIVLALLVATGRHEAVAHGGEDHGEAAPAASSTPGAAENLLLTDGVSDYFELVFKYPPPSPGEETEVRLYLSDYATNRPLEDASYQFAFTPSDATVSQAPVMVSAGIYRMKVRFARDTVYRMVATISAAGRTDFVEVRNIYAGEAAEHFLAEHAVDGAQTPAAENGMPWWGILAGVFAVLIAVVAVVVMRRRKRQVEANVARDPELAQEAKVTSLVESEREQQVEGTDNIKGQQ